ncbi:MAG: hypothetical protein ACKORG_08885 [Actinomycetota bacterium]
MRTASAATLAASTLLAGALLAGTAMSAPAHPEHGAGSSSSSNVQASYMFVFSGPSATMVPVPGTTGTYTFTMPITSSAQPVIWFTVRPSRMTGTIPMTQFAGLWTLGGNSSFAVDPPNVAITTTRKGVTSTFVASMTSTVVTTDGAAATPVIQATMTALQGASLSAVQTSKTSFLKRWAKAPSSTPKAKAGATTVFIERSVCATGNCVPVPLS